MARRMGAATPLADVTEREWDAQLFASMKGLAPTLGWVLTYHTLRSKGSTSGFPDRVLIRDRVLFVELKTEKGPVSDSQSRWLTALASAGAEAYLWRPSDLDEIARVLATRWLFHIEDGVSALWHERAGWTPGSLWLPAGRRHDQNVQEAIAAA